MVPSSLLSRRFLSLSAPLLRQCVLSSLALPTSGGLLKIPYVTTFSSSSSSTHQISCLQTQRSRDETPPSSTASPIVVESNSLWPLAILSLLSLVGLSHKNSSSFEAEERKTVVDWKHIRKEIEALLENLDYDDGSFGPVLVRLAWHSAGTYDTVSRTGGSFGATMRFSPEKDWGANKGLDVARNLLDSIKKRHPEISYADLWTLAGVVAIEAMGGPTIPWRSGRSDFPDNKRTPPDGRLPDASKGQDHIRSIFYRMGFNDREIVALSGAHALGRCHPNRSGYDGPWTNAPTTFSNDYFVQLLNAKWSIRKWDGPLQFEDESKQLMMLPSDIALITDPEFLKFVQLYAQDEELFFKDFAASFSKLLELGVPFR